MKDLSARLGADVSNTAATVDRLESQGLVRKDPHPTDRRDLYALLRQAISS